MELCRKKSDYSVDDVLVHSGCLDVSLITIPAFEIAIHCGINRQVVSPLVVIDIVSKAFDRFHLICGLVNEKFVGEQGLIKSRVDVNQIINAFMTGSD